MVVVVVVVRRCRRSSSSRFSGYDSSGSSSNSSISRVALVVVVVLFADKQLPAAILINEDTVELYPCFRSLRPPVAAMSGVHLPEACTVLAKRLACMQSAQRWQLGLRMHTLCGL